MSQIKTKQQVADLFKGPRAPTVGATYGERRSGVHNATLPPTSQAIQKTVDQFNQLPKRQGLNAFDPNATYKAARRFTNVPYKLSQQHLVEEGLFPKAHTNARKPSDPAILAFLNKVIDTPGMHNPRSVSKATSQGNPVKKS